MQSLSILGYHQHTQISLAHSIIVLPDFQGMESFLTEQRGKQNGTLETILAWHEGEWAKRGIENYKILDKKIRYAELT